MSEATGMLRPKSERACICAMKYRKQRKEGAKHEGKEKGNL